MVSWRIDTDDAAVLTYRFLQDSVLRSEIEISIRSNWKNLHASFRFGELTYDCIMLNQEITIQSSVNNSEKNRFSYKVRNFFARGLGLVEYHATYPGRSEEHYRLSAIRNSEE